LKQKLSIIKLSQLETILNYALQFRLQTKIINFVENGGTITKAAHVFGIGIASIYRWLSRPRLSATKVKSRQRKLD
jgi:Transposase and inactivated derivatives